jgi:hypothetical protein
LYESEIPLSPSFQRSFFLVYFLALLGDWLQGPYVYKLYAYYGFKASQISIHWECSLRGDVSSYFICGKKM